MKIASTSRARAVAAIVLLGGVAACSALTGAGDYVAKDCQGCLLSLCTSEVDTCNSDRGCGAILTCIQQYCPNNPDYMPCITYCFSKASTVLTDATQADITAIRSCGFKNCMSCMSAPSALPEDAAIPDAGGGG